MEGSTMYSPLLLDLARARLDEDARLAGRRFIEAQARKAARRNRLRRPEPRRNRAPFGDVSPVTRTTNT
jgi:hypothetical protein